MWYMVEALFIVIPIIEIIPQLIGLILGPRCRMVKQLGLYPSDTGFDT